MLSACDCGDKLVIAPSYVLDDHTHAGHDSINNALDAGHGMLNTLESHLI